MKIVIEKNYEALSQRLASIIISEFYKDGRVNVDLTDGRSPSRAYEIVAEEFSKNVEKFDNVHFYNHAEIKGDEQLISNVLYNEIHSKFKTNHANIHQMDFNDLNNYVQSIFDAGGLDLMVLGIGTDGHFCCNLVGTTNFEEYVYTFETSLNGVDYDLATLGFKMVNTVKRVILVANGKEKAEAIKTLVNGKLTESFPASCLPLLNNFLVIIDEEAASLL